MEISSLRTEPPPGDSSPQPASQPRESVSGRGSRLILIMGNARSGTSWLSKIFDSHPEVVYRHEPDSDRTTDAFPFLVELGDFERHQSAAAEYLESLCDTRTIRSVGRPPFFDKSYLSPVGKNARIGLISALKLMARAPVFGSKFESVNAPDLFKNSGLQPRYVLKSVISLGRAGLYQRALPNGRLVFIIRHPCGVVASQMRGMKLGKLTHETPFKTICASSVGRRHDLSVEYLSSLTVEEQLAWIWVAMNEKAFEELRDAENAMVVTHEALCMEPVDTSRSMFDFCDLPWSGQTEGFLRQSESLDRKPDYFDVKRNPRQEVEKWKQELPQPVIDRVLGVLNRSSLTELYG